MKGKCSREGYRVMTRIDKKVGDRITNKFTKRAGVILNIWDGKYRVDHYKGEQYNPYRVTVKYDNGRDGVLGNGTVLQKMEHLEKSRI